ncbi:hypothetical protein ANCCEY_06215 [Ancylostoma ceylanicum]|uniref:glucuronosyltransferase n=1 Tax=Ancylostoma ceylanicum TaxID=53326 RepID=A0A0D6M442_9BILA|nr:hypothetical protein ANCCEY_06215 [Ancylostoma ceylanicum]
MAVTALTHLDTLSNAIGEPTAISYLPWTGSSGGDKMTFFGRFRNLFGFMIEQHVIEYIYENELVHFRKKFGDMKGYADLLSQASFLFTNGNPYLDFAHPTLHKTVMIGGISVEQDAMNMKEIDQKWSTILSARPHTVLISFGSMAKSIDMPVHYRQALLDTFSSFPNVTFIWKYENEDSSIAADHPNVYLSSWVPQTALLSKLYAFHLYLTCWE